MKKQIELNETAKYEIWKAIFHKKMENLLTEAFIKYFGGCYLSVYHVDKWNINFKIYSLLPEDVAKLKKDANMKEILAIQEIFGDCCDCKIAAKTEQDLNIKLTCLKLMV